MRRARQKSTEAAFYHIFTRVAGAHNYFPLLDQEACQKLLEIIRFYVSVYCCQLAAYQIMGNHYHLILFCESFRCLSAGQLQQRAAQLYGHRARLKTLNWSTEDWQHFNRKLFDISALMQHINGEYAKWFNRRFERRGHFWADRFKSPELLDPKALQECLLYVELNSLRAYLVERPELYKPSSAWLRFQGRDQELMPLEEIFAATRPLNAFDTYRRLLYQRAGLPQTSNGHPHSSPLFLQPQRFFTNGLAIGTQHTAQQRLEQLRARGLYRHRKRPISQLSGFLFTVREQRSRARASPVYSRS